MIQVEYQLTDEEWRTIQKINGGSSFGYWHMWSTFLLCCLPGLGIAIYFYSLVSILVHVVLLVTFLVLAIWGQTKLEVPKQVPFVVTYDQHYRAETCGKSRHEGKLACFQDWHEDDRFVIRSYWGLSQMEPKRAYSEAQLEQMRSYLNTARQSPEPGAIPPVRIFQEVQARTDRQFVRQYQLERSDLSIHEQGRFFPVTFEDTSGLNEAFGQPSSRMPTFLLLFLIGIGFSVWLFDSPEVAMPVVGTFGLTCVLVYLGFRLSIRWASGSTQSMLNDAFFERELEFGITSDGWYNGNSDSTSFHHWQDIKSFSVSRGLLLVRTINNVYMVPLRIFESPEEAEKFVLASLKLHNDAIREESRKDGVPVEAVESGNPFQPPRAS